MICLTAVAVTATASPVLTAASTGSFFAGACFIDGEGAALEILLMEHFDGFGGLRLGRHLHEREAPGAPRRAILHNIHGDNCPSLREVVLEVVLSGVVREVTYK